MKLYFSPGACSLSPHIVLNELGLPFKAESVDLSTKKTKSGADFRQVNPKGQVPALEMDDGKVLTEGAAIVQYLADRKPEAKLAPAPGSADRYRLQEWLNYIAAEVHKGMGPMFNPKASEEWKGVVRENMSARFDFLSNALKGKDYLMGSFTVADAYLYTILSWTGYAKMDLAKWPVLKAYFDRVGARPAVRATLEAEAKAA
ncbi:MAG TPA: glutathione transferase GstA [Candidatus Bathyarchaeia archaeon]|nr:glutathione transferase GstA [Candidatus Bathyarchaeia archaeon]